ncbi:MAG: Ig-like domain-containing protein, partial [Pseudomonadales bacterium]
GSTGSDVFDLSADAIGDSFYGDQGSDTFIIGDLNFKRIDGGGALEFDGDTLKFTTPDFDLRNVTANQIDSVDTIDMRDGQAGTLQLSVDSALNIGRFLLIAADAGDHIILDAERSGFVFDNFDFGSGGLGDLFFLGGENERQEFATLLVSNEATAQINEANGDITYLGSINADQLTGTAADETFFGREGDDQISAGAGHDTIFYGPDDVTLVDGGDGFDMLIPDASRLASAIDLTTNNPYVNFEIIDLQGQFRDQGESNTLILDMADVGQMGRPNLLFGDGTTQLIIEGTIDDYVILNGQNLREGDPAGLVKGTDSRFPDFVSYSDGTNQILVETTLLGPGVNHAPVPEPDKFTTRGTQAIVLDVLANDRDPDPGDTVTMDFVPSTSDQGASLVLNPDGTIDYDPSGLFFSTQITDTFQYSVIDSNGVTSTTHVDIVIEANTPPEVPANVQGIGVESTTADSFTVDLLATAFDEEGDTLSVDPATISFTGDDSGITLDGNTLIVDPSHLAYADAG